MVTKAKTTDVNGQVEEMEDKFLLTCLPIVGELCSFPASEPRQLINEFVVFLILFDVQEKGDYHPLPSSS